MVVTAGWTKNVQMQMMLADNALCAECFYALGNALQLLALYADERLARCVASDGVYHYLSWSNLLDNA